MHCRSVLQLREPDITKGKYWTAAYAARQFGAGLGELRPQRTLRCSAEPAAAAGAAAGGCGSARRRATRSRKHRQQFLHIGGSARGTGYRRGSRAAEQLFEPGIAVGTAEFEYRHGYPFGESSNAMTAPRAAPSVPVTPGLHINCHVEPNAATTSDTPTPSAAPTPPNNASRFSRGLVMSVTP